MTAVTPEQLGELADRLLPVAAKIACVVHGDGDHRDIAYHTQHRDRQELVTLIVLLGSLVDPDRLVGEALGFVTWDEYGRPAAPPEAGTRTIRGLATDVPGPEALGAGRVLESERIQRARRLHLHDGLSLSAVARELGAADSTVRRWAREGHWPEPVLITQDDARGTKRRPRAGAAA